MHWLVRIISLLVFVFFLLVALAFIQSNAQLYELRFLDWGLGSMAQGVWILLSFILGLLLSALAFLPAFLVLRCKNRQLHKSLQGKQDFIQANADH